MLRKNQMHVDNTHMYMYTQHTYNTQANEHIATYIHTKHMNKDR